MKRRLTLKNNYFLWLLCLTLGCSTAQTPVDSVVAQADYTIEGNFVKFTTDKLQQVYTVDSKNEIVKYSPQGQLSFRYNNNRLGTLGHIDVTDPFNILLYYPDYQTVVTLNRTLAISGNFDFGALGYFQIAAIGMSSDLNLWLYDETTFQLKKLDRNGEILLESEDLNMRLGYAPQANFVLERDNQVFLNDPQQGVLVFDLYGKYQKVIEIKNLTSFQVIDGQLIFQKEADLFVYNLRTLQQRKVKLPAMTQASQQLRLQRRKLFRKDEQGVSVYGF